MKNTMKQINLRYQKGPLPLLPMGNLSRKNGYHQDKELNNKEVLEQHKDRSQTNLKPKNHSKIKLRRKMKKMSGKMKKMMRTTMMRMMKTLMMRMMKMMKITMMMKLQNNHHTIKNINWTLKRKKYRYMQIKMGKSMNYQGKSSLSVQIHLKIQP